MITVAEKLESPHVISYEETSLGEFFISVKFFPMKNQRVPITIDPEIMSGAPVFTGTRVPVDTLIGYLLDGNTLDDFLEDFPTVSRADAVAVLEYAGETLHHPVAA